MAKTRVCFVMGSDHFEGERKMKKIALILAVMFAFGVAGCGEKKGDDKKKDETKKEQKEKKADEKK